LTRVTVNGKRMCNCSKLGLTESHEPNQCPVTASLFCSICQENGHPTMKCPNKAIWHYKKPEFIEQLIPINLRMHYNITSLTPIANNNHEHIPYIHGDPVIEIPYDDDGKNIRATLAAFNLPSSSVKENKRIMNEFGNLIGKKVSILGEGVKDTSMKKNRIKIKMKPIVKIDS